MNLDLTTTDSLDNLGKKALAASRKLAVTSTQERNSWLNAMADALLENMNEILAANAADLEDARKNGLEASKIDRLTLNSERVIAMTQALRHLVALPDPVGRILSSQTRPNGLHIDKVSVPLGVIGIIYESRPNVTVDAASLCIKSGNAVVLRGGSEAFHSNQVLTECIVNAAEAAGMPSGAIQFVPFKGHDVVNYLLKMDRYINVMIPRGSERLIRAVVEQATMPVIKHYKGVCHIYVDGDCHNLEQALDIIKNAKCQRPGVCNALETILIDQKIAKSFSPILADFLKENGVEMHGDELFRQYANRSGIIPATENDWPAEYLALTVAIKIVNGIHEAIAHINQYGSGHSDCILTDCQETAEMFLNEVDSAAVYHNASTRFTDGGEFGMGAEMGISTDKLHVRGPMGLEELNSYKYKIRGNGQIRK